MVAPEIIVPLDTPVEQTESAQETVVSAPTLYRLSITEYLAILESGALADAEHIELLDGWMVQKMTKNPRHRNGVSRARRLLESVLPEGWFVETEQSVITLNNLPEPDIMVIRGDIAQLPDRHFEAQELGLVVEVSDSSLPIDRTAKYRLYAAAPIPEYWILNLNNNTLEVYTEPDGVEDYRQKCTYTSDQSVMFRLNGMETATLALGRLFG